MTLAAHIVFASLWLGCVLTEVFFERTLLAGDRSSHARLAELHLKVDALVEAPAFLTVLLTGILLYRQPHADRVETRVMVIAGAAAIAANIVCVYLVHARAQAARSAHWQDFDRLDRMQHRIGALVLLGILVALAAGVMARHLPCA